ncbi:hypothetical protein QTP88_017913 [Uroleucon formosanum]
MTHEIETVVKDVLNRIISNIDYELMEEQLRRIDDVNEEPSIGDLNCLLFYAKQYEKGRTRTLLLFPDVKPSESIPLTEGSRQGKAMTWFQGNGYVTVHFWGTGETSKGYRIWYKENNKVSLSRDIIFKDESVINYQLVEYSNNLNDNDNEKQKHEQGNGSNVNVYNLRDRSNIKKPLRYDNSAFFVAESDSVNFKEAVESQNSEKWIEAMKNEMESFEQNGTWSLVKLPKDRTIVNCGWTPFLYEDLVEEIYMRQPEGFNNGTEMECRLQRSLYGLSRELNQFLGIEIEQKSDGPIVMHQRLYCKIILEKFNMTEANPVQIPADPQHSLDDKQQNTNLTSKVPYREADTRRSTPGSVFTLGSGSIAWSSRRQQCVNLRTTESEYIALSQAVQELTWLKLFLGELMDQSKMVPTMYGDNQSAIKLVKNPEFHRRTKHIDVRYHYIREKLNEGLFALESNLTRLEYRVESIKAIRYQIPGVIKALEEVSEITNDSKTKSEANSLVSHGIDVEPVFTQKIYIEAKKMFDYESNNDLHRNNGKEIFKQEYFIVILDQAIVSIEERFIQFKWYEENFGFLFNINKLKETNYEDLMKHCKDLQNILSSDDSKDIEAVDLYTELILFRNLVEENMTAFQALELTKKASSCFPNISIAL